MPARESVCGRGSGSAGQCRLYMLLFCYSLYLVCKSQFPHHSQAASGFKIKSPQIKNCCEPQLDTHVKRPGKNFQHSRTKLSKSKAQQNYGDKTLQTRVQGIDYYKEILTFTTELHLMFTWCSPDHHLTFPWPLPNLNYQFTAPISGSSLDVS